MKLANKKRYIGLDLGRGIAAYAVVVQHSGDITWAPVDYWAEAFRNFCSFAVPFFLAASFFLGTSKLYNTQSPYPFISRFQRLLIPYAFWSIFYVVFKTCKFFLFKETDQLKNLFQDPASLILFGGASLQLYFLPLLMTGTFLMLIAYYLAKNRIDLRILALLLVLSIITYHLLIIYVNNFQYWLAGISPNINNILLVRFFLTEISWLLRCLPYVAIAMYLNHPYIRESFLKISQRLALVYLIIFLGLTFFGKAHISPALREIGIAYSSLLFFIAISSNLKESSLIQNLGLCSFGIYLLHPFVLEIIKIFIIKFIPSLMTNVSLLSILIFSLPTFFITWLFIWIMIKHKKIMGFIT